MNILINIWLFCPRRKAKWPFYVQTSLRLFVILNILKTEGPKHGWPASKTCTATKLSAQRQDPRQTSALLHSHHVRQEIKVQR